MRLLTGTGVGVAWGATREGAWRVKRGPVLWRRGWRRSRTGGPRSRPTEALSDPRSISTPAGTLGMDVRGGGGGRPERAVFRDRCGAGRGCGVWAGGGSVPERGSSPKNVRGRASDIGLRGTRPLHASYGGAGSKKRWKPAVHGEEVGLGVAPVGGGFGRKVGASGAAIVIREEGGGADIKGSQGKFFDVAGSGELELLYRGMGGGFLVSLNGVP